MHLVRAAYEHRWVSTTALWVGLAMLATSFALHGTLGSDLRTIGVVVFLAAFTDCRIRSLILVAYRAGYRGGRRVAIPSTVTSISHRDDEDRVAAASK